ncbi:MAG: sensor histidine kinase [Saprospiraceae bacterium]
MSTATRTIQSKKPPFLSERVKLYLWIALAYYLLCRFGELVKPEGYDYWKSSFNSLWIVGYLLLVNFVLFEHTIPFLRVNWKRMLLAPFLLGGHFLLYPFGTYLWRYIGIKAGIYFELKKYDHFGEALQHYAGVGIGSAVFFGLIQHIYGHIKLKQSAQKLLIEKQAAELNYLKSQTNPHFLFNTLNNIYSLAKDKSDLAPDSILRLSEILRFMLYHSGDKYIPIEQEIKIISDYIALEKLRYDDSLMVEFSHELPDQHQPVPPLLLIPLVENAFKHGASETRYTPFVKIQLSVKDGRLFFWVKNSVEESPEDGVFRENIGLSNLRRQLELQYSEFELNLEQGETAFTATLKINLASHV